MLKKFVKPQVTTHTNWLLIKTTERLQGFQKQQECFQKRFGQRFNRFEGNSAKNWGRKDFKENSYARDEFILAKDETETPGKHLYS